MANLEVDSVAPELLGNTNQNEKLATMDEDTPTGGEALKDEGRGPEEQAKEENLAIAKSTSDDAAGDRPQNAPSDEAASSDAKASKQAVAGDITQNAASSTINRDLRPNYSRNIKTDFSTLKPSSDPVEIRKQVEFYFSDANLHTDKFLFSKVQGHRNLPIPIALVHSFKRMRHFQPFDAIVDALKDSKLVQVVDGDKIQRREPLSQEVHGKEHAQVQRVYEDAAMARSIYVKGFGIEKPTTQFDIEAFFTPYGPYNSVRLRRRHDKIFKSSVFVEFETEAIAKAFLALDPPPKWEGGELLIKSKKQYCDDKANEIEAGRIQAKPNWKPLSRGKNRNDDGKDWKTRKAEDQKNGSRDEHQGRGGRGGRGSGGRGRGRGRGQGRGNAQGNNGGSKPRTTEEQAKLERIHGRTSEVISSTTATSEILKVGQSTNAMDEILIEQKSTEPDNPGTTAGIDSSADATKGTSEPTRPVTEAADAKASQQVPDINVDSNQAGAIPPANGTVESKKRPAEDISASTEQPIKKAKVDGAGSSPA